MKRRRLSFGQNMFADLAFNLRLLLASDFVASTCPLQALVLPSSSHFKELKPSGVTQAPGEQLWEALRRSGL